MGLTRLLATLCAGALIAGACTAEPVVPVSPMDEAAVKAEATPQPADMVDLTVYYRHGRGGDVFLTPVKREVPVSDDLPRTALTMLLGGPERSDPGPLRAALPTTTRLLNLSVHDGTADVRLSREAVTDAKQVGDRPEHEAMALASIANTMTEFPDIQRVRLRVEGDPNRRFWGGWGLPRILVRDESVIDPAHRGPHVPPLDSFSARPQRVGVADRHTPPKVAAVRVQSQATYVRVTVEVTAAHGGPLSGPVPPTRVARRGQQLLLRVRGKPGKALGGDILKTLHDPAVKAARVDVRGRPDEVVVALRPTKRSAFWLHTLPEPARVVLDVRR